MGLQRYDERAFDQAVYHEAQIASILSELGLDVTGDTEQVFLMGCPFHHNTGSPAFAVNKQFGTWICFNPSCGVRGNLEQLITAKTGKTGYAASRLIHKFGQEVDFTALIEKELEPVVFEPFDQVVLDRLRKNFPDSKAEQYMISRGFSKETLDHFEIGYARPYTPERYKNYGPLHIPYDSVIVPMHDIHGEPLGFVGRSVEGKSFKNSKGLPKSKTAWNIHRAKSEGNTVILCESSFDVMRIHQAGYPNAIALLGGSLGPHIVEQLNKTFSTFIIFTDNDEAGRALGEQIETKMKYKKILWAGIDGKYPTHGVIEDNVYHEVPCKDATDMTDDQIRSCLQGALTPLEYHGIMDTWQD